MNFEVSFFRKKDLNESFEAEILFSMAFFQYYDLLNHIRILSPYKFGIVKNMN